MTTTLIRELTRHDGPEYAAEFRDWIRAPQPEPRPALQKVLLDTRTMGVSNAASAGYLAPPAFSARLWKRVSERAQSAILRAGATLVPSETGEDMPYPFVDESAVAGRLLGEGATATATDVAMARIVLKSYLAHSDIVRCSWALMQDAGVDFEAVMADLLSDRIARTLNLNLTTGVAPNAPRGVVTAASVGISGATGQTTSVTWDDLLNLQNAVPTDYRYAPSSAYMMAGTTLAYIKRLKDGDGRPLLRNTQRNGQRIDTIDGYVVHPNDDMPAMAAGARSVLFGDFAQYAVRQVRDVVLVRLDEVYAPQAESAFLSWVRADGQLMTPGAVAAYTNAAS